MVQEPLKIDGDYTLQNNSTGTVIITNASITGQTDNTSTSTITNKGNLTITGRSIIRSELRTIINYTEGTTTLRRCHY